MQTDTTKSSISQVEKFKEAGCFVVGTRQRRNEGNDFFKDVRIWFRIQFQEVLTQHSMNSHTVGIVQYYKKGGMGEQQF